MGFRMILPKRVKKVKSKSAQEVLDRLNGFLESADVVEKPVEFLCGFWKDQQTAITYQELREAVLAGYIGNEILQQWRQDYSYLVKTQLNDMWVNAMQAGAVKQPIVEAVAGGFTFQTQSPGILSWLDQRGAEFVTSCTQQQKDAIAALLSKKMIEGHTVDELSRMIRPCIGLTAGQAKANVRYYDSIVENLKKEHPRMKPESIQRKAQDAALKYAERQRRQRAITIAQTESAFAYNRGADEGIRQAQAQGLIGKVVKRWSTSGDDQVCSICQGLEGVEVEMDSGFKFQGKLLFAGQDLLPPAHPRCACAVEYIEVEKPTINEIPQLDIDIPITENDSFREYTDEEINSIAAQTEKILSEHIKCPSKWSGKMVIDDNGIQNKNGHIANYGKLWNCDILTKHKTAPAIILHEQIHARSISHYNQDMYIRFSNIEESSVQLMVEEVCRKSDIEIIESDYKDMVDSLKQIGRYIGIHKTDYDFAKFIIEMPVEKRLDWISDNLYATLGKNKETTVKEYQKWSDLLNMLFTQG